MTEKLLQYIWQFRYFNQDNLKSNTGELLRVIHPGIPNSNQGPDFLEARIQMGETLLVGHIELHLKTTDWLRHSHQSDPNYRQVVLHVVWEDDAAEAVNDIPVLELQQLVPKLLLHQYDHWMNSLSFIPCEQQVSLVGVSTIDAWKERLIVERLRRKAMNVLNFLEENKHHWEESLWWMLARSFGGKVNAPAFEAIARSLPLTILAKHREQLLQLEALLLGQAGLLRSAFANEYPNRLRKEYEFLKNKYKLREITVPVHFLRMRPVSFPTIRLAQLAQFIQQQQHLFANILEMPDLASMREFLNVTAGEFWDYHYTLHETATPKPKRIGEQVTDSIIINTVAPILFAYGQFHQYDHYMERALEWLAGLPPESNRITNGFEQLGLANKTAADSQALLELKAAWCDQKKCLHCGMGNALLKTRLETAG